MGVSDQPLFTDICSKMFSVISVLQCNLVKTDLIPF